MNGLNGIILLLHPAEWFAALLPDMVEQNSPSHRVSVSEWASFTNLRALLSNAKGFTIFEIDEIKRHIAVYMLNGLSPSPQLHFKMKSQQDQPVNGSDIINKALGPNSEKP